MMEAVKFKEVKSNVLKMSRQTHTNVGFQPTLGHFSIRSSVACRLPCWSPGLGHQHRPTGPASGTSLPLGSTAMNLTYLQCISHAPSSSYCSAIIFPSDGYQTLALGEGDTELVCLPTFRGSGLDLL